MDRRPALAGRVALVSGASSGLGEQFARALAGEGARVALGARRVDRLEALAKELRRSGADALPVELDVTSVASIRAAAARVEAALGPIDVLVNNAGVSRQVPTLEIEEDYFDWIVDTNVKGSFFLAQAAARQMVRHGLQGRIINIASTAGLRALPRLVVYSLSKSAVAHMTRAMALEWGPSGINVNCIAPGYISTPMSTNFAQSEAGRLMIAGLPRQRPGEPRDLDALLLLLASGEPSRFLNGAVIPADDGFCAG
jgi:NAD(P)-dependent dehydrogenase (short-subunit alcohol dehydrogenase family)